MVVLLKIKKILDLAQRRGAAKIIAGKNDKSLYGRIKDKTRRIKYNKRLERAQKDGLLKSRQRMYKLKF